MDRVHTEIDGTLAGTGGGTGENINDDSGVLHKPRSPDIIAARVPLIMRNQLQEFTMRKPPKVAIFLSACAHSSGVAGLNAAPPKHCGGLYDQQQPHHARAV